jgi:hypothetical protein
VVDLHTTGRLWVYDERETRFLIIDMNTGTVEQTSFSQNNCSVVLKHDSTDVICRSSTNLSLYDLMTGSTQNLPVTAPDRLYIAPYVQNSRFLVYGNWSEAGDWLVDVSYLDMMTGQERLVIENSPDSEYYISSDGSFVIAEIDNQIIDLLSNPVENLTPVGYENLVYNPYSLAWSPESNLLYIGAADPGSYDFPQTNKYFIVDADTGIVTYISIPSDTYRNAMWGAYWSPDSKQVAIPGGPELCIFRVDELIGECTNTIQESGSSVTYIAWSPDAKFIAFFVSDTIYLYDTETRQYFSLLANMSHTGLIFWR